MQLADYPLVLSIISGTNNDIRIDPDAEVCFFYGCFKDTLNFDNACYVNSTNMAICKGKLIILINVCKIISFSNKGGPSSIKASHFMKSCRKTVHCCFDPTEEWEHQPIY